MGLHMAFHGFVLGEKIQNRPVSTICKPANPAQASLNTYHDRWINVNRHYSQHAGIGNKACHNFCIIGYRFSIGNKDSG